MPFDVVRPPVEELITGGFTSNAPLNLKRSLTASGTGGRDISVGLDSDGCSWVYSYRESQATGMIDSFVNLFYDPTSREAGHPSSFVIAGLIRANDSFQFVEVQLEAFRERCRVHENVWTTPPLLFQPGARPSVRWYQKGGIESKRFDLPPLDEQMLGPQIKRFGRASS